MIVNFHGDSPTGFLRHQRYRGQSVRLATEMKILSKIKSSDLARSNLELPTSVVGKTENTGISHAVHRIINQPVGNSLWGLMALSDQK